MTSTQRPDAAAPPLAPSADTPARLLFPDLAGEFATTRRVLERVPDDRLDWAPHEKSMTLGRLATHLSELPRFGVVIASTPELDFAKREPRPATLGSRAEMLAQFDELSAAATRAVEGMTWEELGATWTMRMGDHVILQGPRAALLRQVGISHVVHHRAQLGVYLRLLGVAVPKVYGPSADEQ